MSPDAAAIERAWHIGRRGPVPFARRFNVAPTAVVPVLNLDRDSKTLELSAVRWGFVPSWWRDARPPAASFNARMEEALLKPMWRDALRRARCLVPAEGWYEWQEQNQGAGVSAPTRRPKRPYYITRGDRQLLCFAGVLSRWVDPETGEALLSCAILTTAARGALATVHARMPVVAPDALQMAWLDREATDVSTLCSRLAATSVDALRHYPVGTRVNDARADGPELIEPAPAGS